jgi:hypothetical protein
MIRKEKKYEETAKVILQKTGSFLAKIFPTIWKILKDIGRGLLNLLFAMAKIIKALALTILVVIVGIFLAVVSVYFLAQTVGLSDSPAFQQLRDKFLELHLADFSTDLEAKPVEIQ